MASHLGLQPPDSEKRGTLAKLERRSSAWKAGHACLPCTCCGAQASLHVPHLRFALFPQFHYKPGHLVYFTSFAASMAIPVRYKADPFFSHESLCAPGLDAGCLSWRRRACRAASPAWRCRRRAAQGRAWHSLPAQWTATSSRCAMTAAPCACALASGNMARGLGCLQHMVPHVAAPYAHCPLAFT